MVRLRMIEKEHCRYEELSSPDLSVTAAGNDGLQISSRSSNGKNRRDGYRGIYGHSVSPPIISVADTLLYYPVGCDFEYPAVSAFDLIDGTITDRIVVTGNVDCSTPGEYILTYAVTDDAGNKQTATVRVVVEDLTSRMEYKFVTPPPEMRISGVPVDGIDGDYYVAVQGNEFYWVETSGKFAVIWIEE